MWRTRSKVFAWHVKPLYEVIPFPVKGELNFFEVDDALLKRLPDGYEDHCDYMYQQGLVQTPNSPAS